MTTDFLLFEEGERESEDDLKLRFEAIAAMPAEDQDVAMAVLDAMIVKSQVSGTLARMAKPAAKAKSTTKKPPTNHEDMSTKAITPVESLATGTITKHIVVMRHHKVLLDTDLAELYGVPTKVLVQAVKRNADRFPSDFMFQLDTKE